MKRLLHIVTQCTDRKKAAVRPELRLRSTRGHSLESRAKEWTAALGKAAPASSLRELYAGEHWVASLQAEQVAKAQGYDVRLWVVSAGLGFVSVDQEAPAYSATFTANVPDTVLRGHEEPAVERARWLELVGSAGASPSLGDLAAEKTNAAVVCVLSKPYLQAMRHQLEAAAGALKSPEQLVLVTSEDPASVSSGLSTHWVPSSARLKSRIGGSRIGQHARVVNALLESSAAKEVSASSWRELVTKWLDKAPELERYDRSPLSDDEVRRYLKNTKAGSWSKALRELRASGRACEQKRFRSLFQEVHAA